MSTLSHPNDVPPPGDSVQSTVDIAESTSRSVVRRRLTTITAFTMVAAPVVQYQWAGSMPLLQGSVGALGVMLFSLGQLHHLRSSTKNALMVCCLAIHSTIVLVHTGFTPVFTASYILLVIVAGLLGGRLTMGVVIGCLPVALLAIGHGVELGLLQFPSRGRDPNRLSHWVRVTVLFFASFANVWVVIASCSDFLSTTHARLRQRQAEVGRSRRAMLEVRDARIKAEKALMPGQKSESIERIGRGLALHFRTAIAQIRALVEALPTSAPKAERVGVSRSVQLALAPSLQVTDDLMVLSRLNAPDRIQATRLRDVVKTTCRSMGVAETGTATVLRVNLAPELEAFGSQGFVQQAVLNLVMNAIEATPSGLIQVTTAYAAASRGKHTHAVVVVEDSGHGIPAEDLQRAFEPFHSSRLGQTGLGLAVAQSIAVQNGGQINIRSMPGLGTRAVLSLRLKDAVRVGSVRPSIVMPLKGMLHPVGWLAAVDEERAGDGVPVPALESSPAEINAWRLTFARQLAGAMACVVSVLGLVRLPVAQDLHTVIYLCSAAYVVALSWVFFSRRATPNAVYGVLLVGALIVAQSAISLSSFDNAVGMASLTTALCWGLLFKRTRTTGAMVLFAGMAFVGTGWLREHHWPLPSSIGVDMNNASSWFRLAPQLFVFVLVIGVTVVGVLHRLKQSNQRLSDGLLKSEELRLEESQEIERRVALEKHRMLREQMAVRSRLVGSLAHDLRNTLQLITNIELIEEPDLSQRDLRQILSDVQTGLADAEQLSALLQTHTVETLQTSPVREHVRRALRLLEPKIDRTIHLILELEECGEVWLSPTEIRRIVTNLVNNSCDAMPTGGTLRITLHRGLEVAYFTIGDTGLGMDEEVALKVFDAYFSTKEHTGTGLGLHAVQEIMVSCGGHISVESTPGVGTTFRLTFPLANQTSPLAPV